MAASSSTCSKKAFTFKKKNAEQVLIDDDDDDDFKPSKFPFPGKGSSVASTSTAAVKEIAVAGILKKKVLAKPKASGKAKQTSFVSGEKLISANIHEKENEVEVDGECEISNSNAAGVYRVGQGVSERSEVKELVENESVDEVEVAIEEVTLDETDNCDIMVLHGVGSSSGGSGLASSGVKTDGKEAWKNLMGKMQKSQVSLPGKASKRGKPSTKRALVQSPKPKVPNNQTKQLERSPLKKTARLVGEVSTVPYVSSLKEVKHETTEASFLNKTTFANSSKDLQPGLCVKEDSTTKEPIKVAPIFLPPAERKALCKAPLTKVSDTAHLLESIIDCGTESQNNNLPEDPSHFDGTVVILNDYQPNTDPYEGKKTKVCPFYKKLPGVPFCVDAFNYGLIPGMEVYFLSHFHSDHYIGLTKKFCKTIICSHPTGNLVRMKLYVEEKCIRKLHLNKPYTICDSEVTLMDANHCPGSVMFIFRFKNGTVTLHTGDFRYTPDMLRNPYLSGLRVDNLYLDTTYCSPEYDFPTQTESIANVVLHVKRHLDYRPQTLILCGSYLIGKERVYFTLAEAIGSKVYGTIDKRKTINALENRKFSSLLSADETSQVHVVPMFSITAKNLQEYLAKYPQYTNIIGIKPSGWQFSSCGSGCSVKAHYNGTVTVLGVPYSEHSSFSELKAFVTSLKPKKVQPTVNVGNPKKRGDMMQHIESWLSS